MVALKLPFHFDVHLIMKEINSIPKNEFIELYSINIAKGSVQALHLIEPVRHVNADQKVPFKPTTRLQQLNYLQTIMNTFPSRKETYRIHKLMPGGEIRKHRDVCMNFEEGLFRVHIPVQTNEKSIFNLFGENLHMRPGECWYLDIDLEHYVQNHGELERIHLIMDCQRNEWWDNIFEKAGYKNNLSGKYSRMKTEELISMKQKLKEMAYEGPHSILLELNKELEKRKVSN